MPGLKREKTLAIHSFDAAALIQECVDVAQPLVGKRPIRLQGDGPDSLLVHSDAVKIQRILQNLFYNALKYTQSGWVHVSWAQENETRWILSVQDSGAGFPPTSPPGLLAES
ncbi:hypothetical protein GCM10028808_29980 [Spirosoma migulaei]